MNVALITYYLRWRLANRFKIVVAHLMQIIDSCEYNNGSDMTIFSKGDYYVDEYFYDLIYVGGMRPEWMSWVKVE
jgi:hypothetical protein